MFASKIVAGQLEATVLDYGLRLVDFRFSDLAGHQQPLILGGWPIQVYEQDTAYHGAIVGRTCNRIRQGELHLNGQTYQLDKNEGPHHLHGGFSGLHNRVWRVNATADGLQAATEFSNGESGYPGNVAIAVNISIQDDTLCYEYQGESDADTLLDMTNHAYFCLDNSGSILDHELLVPADKIALLDHELLPTGEFLSVVDTPFDFKQARAVGQNLHLRSTQTALAGGFDHSWAFDPSEDLRAKLYSPNSQIQLTVRSNSPALQIYTGNHLPAKHSGVCLETQHLPDACHHSEFKMPVLKAGESFSAFSSYQIRQLS
ncbi:MAG: aldose epimerase family protein [Pseudomonadales bacterium]